MMKKCLFFAFILAAGLTANAQEKVYVCQGTSYTEIAISSVGDITFSADGSTVTIGEKKMIPFFNEDGTYEMRNTIKLGLTIDERIADGYYFAKTLRLVRKIFANPELLDLPAATPIDID